MPKILDPWDHHDWDSRKYVSGAKTDKGLYASYTQNNTRLPPLNPKEPTILGSHDQPYAADELSLGGKDINRPVPRRVGPEI